MKFIYQAGLMASFFLISTITLADIVIPIQSTLNGKSLGSITVRQTQKGSLFIPHLHSLPPGPHGFHVHQHASCDNKGEAACGHLDPQNTGKHLGPYNSKGHLGDLPRLIVDNKGRARQSVLAPRITLADLKGHSLMIHAGSDNYSDNPKLGGGGARIACGVIAE